MVTLIILDGFGESEEINGNAIKLQGTPNLDKLKSIFPNINIEASGEFVGLSAGQMGNSEVGHLTIGSGRVIKQDLEKINEAIDNREFFDNKFLNRACEFTFETGGALHLVGMVSNGGVHSHINHLKALIELAKMRGVKKVFIHAITDGRDTEINGGKKFVCEIDEFCKNTPARIVSICGRAFAMDRESRWIDKTMPFFDLLTLGKAESFYSPDMLENVFDDSYEAGVFDEYIKPTIIGAPEKIQNGDAVIFFNFRPDRMRQIATALTQEDFNIFPRSKLNLNYFVSMCEFDKSLKKIKVAFGEDYLENTLSEVLSKNNLTQLHIAETTKYAHVTYYFNGGREQEFAGEKRVLIPSHADPDFTHNPEMKAIEITAEVSEAIQNNKFDFILVNFSNPDMLGHTANLDATKKAVEICDKCAYVLATLTIMNGGDCIITADHGNAEKLINPNGSPCTTHTTNPVPFILLTPENLKAHQEKNQPEEKRRFSFFKKNKQTAQEITQGFVLKSNGALADIAPTILELLNIPKPAEFTGSSLIQKNPRN